MRLLLFLLLVSAAFAEKTHTEVLKATTPKDDAKPNSAEVPEAVSTSAKIDRVVILRLKFQADLLAGLEQLIAKEKIRNAVILSGVGSLRNYHIHSVSNRDFPSRNLYIKDTVTPADIISVNGYVINGKLHAHMTLADGDKSWGGHIEQGNSVFTFAIVTLGVLSDEANLDRFDDKTYR